MEHMVDSDSWAQLFIDTTNHSGPLVYANFQSIQLSIVCTFGCAGLLPRMEHDKTVDFVDYLEKVPLLLEACVGDDTSALSCLRLLSRNASRVVMLGLKSCTLTLRGRGTDTDIKGAHILRHAHLHDLHLRLGISGGL